MITDEKLVAECLSGDENAFRLLVERFRPRLFALAYGIIQDTDQASDVVQDAFLKAYGALGEYRGTGAFGAWLRRILVNQCMSHLRSRSRFMSLEDLDREIVCPDRGPEERIIAASEAERLEQAMSCLPTHHRTALVLRAVEGLSYREISHLLEVPESTVETWIHRGRLKMRAVLTPVRSDGEEASHRLPRSFPAAWVRGEIPT